MKSLEEQMAVYAACHRDARNRATHFVGVPMIMLAILVPLSWPGFQAGGFSITAAMLLAAAVLAYYFVLDVPLALGMLAVLVALLWLAELIASLGARQGWTWFAVLFAGGWALQLAGHAFEGRKPALVDNLFQIFVAPIFLAAEVFFALGYKPELRRRVSSAARTAPRAPSF
jgi:uncharacterized membrane protein YGL010W